MRFVLLFIFHLIVCVSVFGQNKITNQIAVKFKSQNNEQQKKNQNTIQPSAITVFVGVKKISLLHKISANQRTDSPSILTGIYIIHCDNKQSVLALCERLNLYSNVVYAEPIYEEELLYIPNDPEAQQGGSQEHLSVIKAYEAWDINQGNPNMVIGIIDSGLDLTHEDISANIYINENEIPDNNFDDDENGYVDDYQGYDFADNDPAPQAETSFHGNRVGGVAGAVTDNEIGIAGTGFNTKISPLKAFQTTSNISKGNYEAIIYAADNNYDVINLSWGSAGGFSRFNQDVINYAALEKDVVIIAAAGNTPEELDFYPASYDNVLSVSSTNLDDSKASFATFSTNVDLVAPGNQIYSSFKDNEYARDNGTSYSAPMVAGAAALVRAQYPELSALQVMELIRVNTDEIYDLPANISYFEKLGSGRLNMEKALLKDKNKSLRITEHSPSGSFAGFTFYDDSIALNLTLHNYLGSLKNANLAISSQSSYVTILKSNIQLGSVSANTKTNNFDQLLYVSEDTPPGEEITIRIGVNDDNYLDYQYLHFTTQGDYLANVDGDFFITIAGNGNLGYAEDGYINGSGVVWKGQKLADNIGLAASANGRISDNWPLEKGGIIRSRDFFVEQFVKLQKQPQADFNSVSIYNDGTANKPLGVTIEQNTYAFDSTILGNGMILQSRLINTSSDTLKDLKLGLFVNWDLENHEENQSYYDQGVLISQNSSKTLFTGIKVLDENDPVRQAIDIDNFDSNSLDISLVYNDSLKIALLQESRFDSAGFMNKGNDVLNILGTRGNTLLASETIKKAFILAAASTLDSLFLTISTLEERYEQILNQPPLLAKFISCEGAQQVIVPESGFNFRFYKDPFGQNFITENDSITISGVSGDSSIYVQKVGDSYLSDFQRIDIQLNAKVSDFIMSTDTLYLDDPQKNLVTFVDASFNPITWLWDFGNGTKASIQNPTIVYDTPGLYQISLSVENEVGCIDTEIQQLLVVNRPAPALFDIQLVCKGENLLLSNASKDTLRIYQNENDRIAYAESTLLSITNIENDTSIYVSRIENGFESLKSKVAVRVSRVEADFTYQPDLDQENTSILLINSSTADSIQWNIDNIFYYTDSLSIPVTSALLVVKLEVFDSLTCYDSKTQEIIFSKSAIPQISFNQPCLGEDLTLKPQNGTYFGLYNDEALQSLVSKGQQFELPNVSDTSAFYIVGLDSITPSDPIAILVEPILFEPHILVSPPILYLSESKRINLETMNREINEWNWYLNNSLIETAPNPIIFFDSVSLYQIVLNTFSVDGCFSSDTLNYSVQQKRPVILGVDNQKHFKLYPNPVIDELTVQSEISFHKIRLSSLTGKKLITQDCNSCHIHVLNIESIDSGIYFLSLFTKNGIITQKLYKKVK